MASSREAPTFSAIATDQPRRGAVELFELLGLLGEELLAVGGTEASGTGFGEGVGEHLAVSVGHVSVLGGWSGGVLG